MNFYRRFCSENGAAAVFVVAMVLGLAIYAVLSFAIGGNFFARFFFNAGGDSFMDFFNSVRDVAQGAGVYTERKVIYPPLANLFFLLFLRLTPKEYAATSFPDRYSWKNYSSLTILISLFLLFSVFLYLAVARKKIAGAGKLAALTAFFSVVNVPMLYLLERGNIVIYAIICVMIFMFGYDSPSRLSREIGIFALAAAFALKIYPAVFGWVLISDKRWKDAVKCVLYGLILFIVPSLFFGGLKCIPEIFKNIFDFSGAKKSWAESLGLKLNIPTTILNVAFYLFTAVSVVSFVIASYIIKEKWKVFLFAVSVLMSQPSVFAVYSWGLFIPPLLMFMSDREAQKNPFNCCFAAVAALPFPLFFFANHSALSSFAYTLALAEVISMCVYTIVLLVSRLRKKSPPQIGAAAD